MLSKVKSALPRRPLSKGFSQPVGIARNNSIGRFKNIFSGTIILLQSHGGGIGIITIKIENILYLGTTPTVDGLVIITHSCDTNIFSSQHSQPRILNGIGILKFIHQNLAETLLIMSQ